MLHLFRNRLATCLLAVVYSTAGAAGNLLHSHVHGDHAHGGTAGGICQHSHGHEDGEHGQHDHDSPGEHHEPSLGDIGAGHDDDCTICRAAGQRVVPAQNVQVVELCGLVEPLRIVAIPETIAVSARTQHSRAPPRAI